MDRLFHLNGLQFVWDEDKAATNLHKHGVAFENACEVFLDPLLQFQDATVAEQSRQAVIGLTLSRRLLFVVHVELGSDFIRLVSARQASNDERFKYEDNA